MVARKPELQPGQKFGQITIVQKLDGERNKNSHQLYLMHCGYCGSEFKDSRYDVESGKRKSCRCLGRKYRKKLVDHKRSCADISGQRFGSLVAVSRTHQLFHGKRLWELRCNCGNSCYRTYSSLKTYANSGYQINCGDRSNHQVGLWYPPTPNPYPKEAGALLEKYLKYTRTRLKKNAPRIEDQKRDRLIRAAWIIVYRRSQGEVISEEHEKAFILKHLAWSSVDVFWEQKLEESGGLLYTNTGNKKQIGGAMTNEKLLNYPVSESPLQTQGNALLSKKTKHHKFKRC